MSLRILYVEDNALVREMTTELLTLEPREIVALSTAEDALSAFKASRFDVVITDVSLPTMSGLDLARTILAIRPDAPIIIASGYVLNVDLETWGPNVRALVKPFDTEELNSLVDLLAANAAGS